MNKMIKCGLIIALSALYNLGIKAASFSMGSQYDGHAVVLLTTTADAKQVGHFDLLSKGYQKNIEAHCFDSMYIFWYMSTWDNTGQMIDHNEFYSAPILNSNGNFTVDTHGSLQLSASDNSSTGCSSSVLPSDKSDWGCVSRDLGFNGSIISSSISIGNKYDKDVLICVDGWANGADGSSVIPDDKNSKNDVYVNGPTERHYDCYRIPSNGYPATWNGSAINHIDVFELKRNYSTQDYFGIGQFCSNTNFTLDADGLTISDNSR